MKQRMCVAVAAIIASILANAPTAFGGTATVYQCVGPYGQLAGTDMLHPAAPSGMSTFLGCGDAWRDWKIELGRGTSGNFDISNGDLVVSGPPGTNISGGQIERQIFGYAYSAGAPRTWGFGYRLSRADGTLIERCGTSWPYSNPPETCGPTASGAWQFPSNVVELPRASMPLLRVGYGCYQTGDNCQRTLSGEMLGIRRMALRVDDVVAPVVTGAIGPLAADAPVASRTVSINASDVGLGLYRLIVTVDGRVTEMQSFAPATDACRDVDPSTPDPYEFNWAAACPTSSTSRSFYLTSLPVTGPHQVRVDVEDASGNRTAAIDRITSFALPPETLRCPEAGCVQAPPTPNGVNASTTAKLAISTKRTVGVAYGRAAAISGRLVNAAGAPIGTAHLEVSEQQAGTATWRSVGQIQTDADGRFRYVAPKGTSRVVGFQYRPTVEGAAVAARAQVIVRVRAGVTMTLRPKTVNPGGSVRVRGRLLGTQVQQGTLVELQALDGREWRTFKTLQVRRGRFSYRYRFSHSSGGAQFLLRVYAREQAGLPYAAGTSRAAWVSVRP